MAYTRRKLIDDSLHAIEENKLIWIEEIFAFVPFSSSTFYNHELEKLEAIKKAIEDNRVNQKTKLREKWYKSDNPTLQIALYKLLASDQEYIVLSTQKIDHTTKGESLNQITVTADNNETKNEIEKLIDFAAKNN